MRWPNTHLCGITCVIRGVDIVSEGQALRGVRDSVPWPRRPPCLGVCAVVGKWHVEEFDDAYEEDDPFEAKDALEPVNVLWCIFDLFFLLLLGGFERASIAAGVSLTVTFVWTRPRDPPWDFSDSLLLLLLSLKLLLSCSWWKLRLSPVLEGW